MFTKENQHTLSQKNHLSICHANCLPPPPPPPPTHTHTQLSKTVYINITTLYVYHAFLGLYVYYLFKPLNVSQHN